MGFTSNEKSWRRNSWRYFWPQGWLETSDATHAGFNSRRRCTQTRPARYTEALCQSVPLLHEWIRKGSCNRHERSNFRRRDRWNGARQELMFHHYASTIWYLSSERSTSGTFPTGMSWAFPSLHALPRCILDDSKSKSA